MTNEIFQQMKADLKETYKTELCEESLAAIDAASNVKEFIDILHEFSAFLRHKNIPQIDWVRKWFGDEWRDEANECGCYIDQYAAVKDPTTPIVLFGKSVVNLTITKPRIYNVVCQDESKLNYLAFGITRLNVRLKDNATASVWYRDRTAEVKIHKF